MATLRDRQSRSDGGGPPGAPSAAFLLISLGRIAREDAEAALRRTGLSLRHLSALGHLTARPGLSYSELGRRAGVTAQSMQATLQHLEHQGAVERRSRPGRGRTAELHVTAAGLDLIRQGQSVITDIDQRLLGDIPDDERHTLTALLSKVFTSAAVARQRSR